MLDECQTRSEKLGVLDVVTASRPRPQTIGMNEDAFGVFYERTSRPLWAYLQRVSGDRDIVDDLFQESYCRMLSANLPTMDEGERKSYLFRIATNLLRDRWRRGQVANRLTAPTESYQENVGFLVREAEIAGLEGHLPSSSLIWWRRQLAAKNAALTRATAPITLVTALSFLAGALALLWLIVEPAEKTAVWSGAAKSPAYLQYLLNLYANSTALTMTTGTLVCLLFGSLYLVWRE